MTKVLHQSIGIAKITNLYALANSTDRWYIPRVLDRGGPVLRHPRHHHLRSRPVRDEWQAWQWGRRFASLSVPPWALAMM